MKNIYLAVIALFLSGCAVSKQTYGPDGSTTHSINCSGTALTWGACYEKAGELCGAAGYTVITSSQDQGASAVATNAGFFASSIMNRTMMVKCGH